MKKDITIRQGKPSDATSIASLLIKSWQENYAAFLPQDFLDNMDMDRQIQRHKAYLEDKGTYYLAENLAGKLIGFASFGENREDSLRAKWELYTIYVATAFQGQGLGKTLIRHIIRDIPDLENGLLVWVMSQNPFKLFYLKQGFVQIAEEVFDFGRFEVLHEAYLLLGDPFRKS